MAELLAIVEEARAVPMTAGCMVPRGDVLDLLDDIKGAIPTELDDAQDVLDQRDAVVGHARENADATISAAKADADGMVAAARAEADRLVGEARAAAETLPPAARIAAVIASSVMRAPPITTP